MIYVRKDFFSDLKEAVRQYNKVHGKIARDFQDNIRNGANIKEILKKNYQILKDTYNQLDLEVIKRIEDEINTGESI